MATKDSTVSVENEQIQDIDLSVTRKKKFRIDGDNNRILELNTSDAGIMVRMNNLYPKMKEIGNKLTVKISEQSEITDDEELGTIAEAILELDNSLRNMLDELFDSNVSEVCIPEGTTVDPFNGEFRFETIIEKLGKLYSDNFTSEFAKMKRNINKHTAKYTSTSKYTKSKSRKK